MFASLFKSKRDHISKVDNINYSLEACVQTLVSKCYAELREPDDEIITQNE